ncbi:MAG: radical SAM protein [Acidobacteriota bacterium]
MTDPAEVGLRLLTRWDGRIRSLPILALTVHTACNCRCVMCDIWKANADNREISIDDLTRYVDALRRLRVRRVMLTGGEPLLHRNLWALCDLLRDRGLRVTLVTTGLLIEPHAAEVARTLDDLVVSIDGPPGVHDEIRRVRGAFERIARGLRELTGRSTRPHITARCVVQRANHAVVAETVEACAQAGVDRISFLAADVSSTAFNRPTPWEPDRRREVALSSDDLVAFDASIRDLARRGADLLASGFVVGGLASLTRIHEYYRALAGQALFPVVRCNAPWVSAVLEPGGRVRPCFFHAPYDATADEGLDAALNSAQAIAFRQSLQVESNETCRRCVCSLSLPVWREA